jgi:diaminopimelate decarboxylase
VTLFVLPVVGHGKAVERHGSANRPIAEHDAVYRYRLCRNSFRDTEIACRAISLMDPALARWVRQEGLAVDVWTSHELGIAITEGIDPARIVVRGDALSDPELRCVANVGVGRIVVGSASQVDFVAVCTEHRTQGVLVQTTDSHTPRRQVAFDTPAAVPSGLPFATRDTDNAVSAVLAQHRLNLEGLHCDVGSQDGAFASYAAAVSHMIAEMARLRRRHGKVLTRLSLHRDPPLSDSRTESEELAERIDEALDDACASMRFPRPRVLLSFGST